MSHYKHLFGFQREPFPQDIKVEDLYPLPGLKALADQFCYALDLGAISVITGWKKTTRSGYRPSLTRNKSMHHPPERQHHLRWGTRCLAPHLSRLNWYPFYREKL